jgi:putative intracellular protease/amidase
MRSQRAALAVCLGLLGLAAALLAFGAAPPATSARPPRVAILIFEGVQLIDFTGPYEVFSTPWSKTGRLLDVYTVAERPGPVTTSSGLTVTPRYSFADAPAPDILVLPGGGVPPQLENPRVMRWIGEQAKGARIVLSVCNGAFFLARAGMLDGLGATTFAGLIGELRAAAPKTRVVSDQRFVDNGKIITTAGLSSGIDGALHVLERLYGRGRAQRVALNLEYDWRPDSGYARAALADRYVAIDALDDLDADTLLTQGGRERWERQWSVRSALKPGELLDRVDAELAGPRKWIRQPASSLASSAPLTSAWTFRDETGRPWRGTASVAPLQDGGGDLKLTMAVRRAELPAR